jgi:FkbM family methyltransferase
LHIPLLAEAAALGTTIALHVRTNAVYLPGIAHEVRNWPPFILHRLGLISPCRVSILSTGVRIETHEQLAAATIGVIFVKRDYGVVETGWIVVDIGANIGIFSLYAGRTSSIVYCYEPVQANFELLRKNIVTNGLSSRVSAFPFAVGGKNEQRDIRTSYVHVGHSLYSDLVPDTLGSVKVQCLALDDIFDQNGIDRCDLLKLDCEGAEFESLYAASPQTLRRIKRIRMEFHETHGIGSSNQRKVSELITFLTGNWFQVQRLRHDGDGRGLMWLERLDA